MDTQVTSWLNDGLRHYSSGDAARALEAWYRILEVEPTHPAALEYVAFVRDTFRADGSPVAVAPANVVVEAAPTAIQARVAAPIPFAVAVPLAARRVDSVDEFSWADLVSDAGGAPAPSAPVDVVAVVIAPVEIAFEDDGGVDVEMTDDEPVGLPSMIVEQDDDVVFDEPVAGVDVEAATTVSPSMFVEAEAIEVDVVDVVDVVKQSVLVAPASLLPASGENEVMPAPGPFSAARSVPRRLTPLSMPAPPLTIDFDALVRSVPSMPAIEVASVFLDPPRIDLPRAPTPMAMTTSIASPSAPLEDRVMRQSIRFDEPRAPARGASAAEGSGPVVIAPASSVSPPPLSPWDDVAGPAELLDLDVSTRPTSSFDSLLHAATSEVPFAAAVADEEPNTSVGEAPSPPHVDELESLMTGARELFELGDFTGSLELVEKVLRSNDKHEGARAYLKRNESTLLRMYESKIGDMTRVPRPLVPPDEVIWMNMHHRAGFILSQVDGTLSYEDLLEVSGMDRFDTVRIVADLVSTGIIG